MAVDGLDAALRKMRGLAPGLVKTGLRAAVRKGAIVVAKAAQANARTIDDPTTARSIAKNIAYQSSPRLGKQVGGVAYRVGVEGGAKNVYANNRANRKKGIVGQATGGTGGSTWYWRFIEFGTSKLQARPFMRPALERNVTKATNAIFNEIGPQIDKQLAKLK